MFNRLTELREKRENGDKGFTLIELLVVVVIIGILIAIAIPLYLNYRRGANDKAAQSDLRGAISTLEQCMSDNNAYPATVTVAKGGSGTACDGETINSSSGTQITYIANSTKTSYDLFATNDGGNGGYYCYVAEAGGSVVKKSGNAPTTYEASCTPAT
jgi:type IV pilus assembly protein PilA